MNDATPPSMTSHRPYLIRALYEWIADNGMTPHLLVDATWPSVRVPTHAVQEGRIVLNVAERAVAGLRMDNDLIAFSARFGGVGHAVSVPVGAVLAIYARETGQGMALPEDPNGEADAETAGHAAQGTGRPALSAVPGSAAAQDPQDDEGARGDGREGSDDPDGDGPDDDGPRRGGHLRVVK